ncbi:MAG: acyltransferase family protein [Ruminococcus sp.]|nr:acyltransferase family protein [Ruminococcus sp.]
MKRKSSNEAALPVTAVPAKPRIQWLDIAKGIGILCVIIGHCVDPNGLTFKLIFSFHMPLFYMLSGYTFKKEPFSKAAFMKDLRRLILPYIAVRTAYCISEAVKGGLLSGENVFPDMWEHFLTSVNGNVVYLHTEWFLLSLFWARTVYRLVLEKITVNRTSFVCMTAIFIILVSQQIHLKQTFDAVFPAMLFMEAGYLLKGYEQTNITHTSPRFLLQLAMPLLWIYLAYSTEGFLDFHGRGYPQMTLSLITALLGVLSVMDFSKSLESVGKSLIVRFLEYVGRYSMNIYIIHCLDELVINTYSLSDGQTNTPKLAVIRLSFDLAVFFLYRGTVCLWGRFKKSRNKARV